MSLFYLFRGFLRVSVSLLAREYAAQLIPLIKAGLLLGELDIDSPEKAASTLLTRKSWKRSLRPWLSFYESMK